eukprot:4308717-Pleurochrysis_carterae.AAC.2
MPQSPNGRDIEMSKRQGSKGKLLVETQDQMAQQESSARKCSGSLAETLAGQLGLAGQLH